MVVRTLAAPGLCLVSLPLPMGSHLFFHNGPVLPQDSGHPDLPQAEGSPRVAVPLSYHRWAPSPSSGLAHGRDSVNRPDGSRVFSAVWRVSSRRHHWCALRSPLRPAWWTPLPCTHIEVASPRGRAGGQDPATERPTSPHPPHSPFCRCHRSKVAQPEGPENTRAFQQSISLSSIPFDVLNQRATWLPVTCLPDCRSTN